jgi:hypothetical protein
MRLEIVLQLKDDDGNTICKDSANVQTFESKDVKAIFPFVYKFAKEKIPCLKLAALDYTGHKQK